LDEPTNDLDLESLSVLEEAVRGYTGCLLVVSHDRAFLDRVCTHILHLPGDGSWTLHTGGWSTWQQTQRQAPQVTKVKRDTQSASASSAAPPKLTYAESIRLDGIEAELESLEAQISALEVKLGQPEVINQHQKLREVSQAHATLSEQRDGLYGLWESLMDKQSAWDDWRNSN
ncbi:MAG TPA: hypothetical protein DCQ06_12530, partial [Myxococcales bacterium]|nr:hypothetical protein [Myxococcales bacterium]